RTFVVDRLAEGWTPEQIAGWLRGGNEPALWAVGCETIYAFIYRAAQQAEPLWRYLTRHHKRRRPRRSRSSQDTIKHRILGGILVLRHHFKYCIDRNGSLAHHPWAPRPAFDRVIFTARLLLGSGR